MNVFPVWVKVVCIVVVLYVRLLYNLYIYSTTKETHQSFLVGIIENWRKKWKYIYAIFLNNQFCINSLNNVTAFLKPVHAVRQCLHKGPFKKNDKLLTGEWISRSRLNQFPWVNFVKTGMILYCSNNCIIMRPNRMHVMSYNVHVNPRPFLSNLKLLKIPRLHWTIPVASPESG